MPEFTVAGVPHRTRNLNAYDQFHLLRAVTPILPTLSAMAFAMPADDGAVFLNAMAIADDEAVSTAYAAAAGACERLVDEMWVPATKALPLDAMQALVGAVVEANFTAYFAVKRPDYRPVMGQGLKFEPVSMPDDEDWLYRPTQEQPPCFPFMALFDGSVKIEHALLANLIIAVRHENEARARKAAETK